MKSITFKQFVNWLLPPGCAFCQSKTQKVHTLCPDCLNNISSLQNNCPVCAESTPGNFICGACLKQPPYFRKVYTISGYEAPLSKLITDFKFHAKLSAGKTLSQLMINTALNWYQNQPLPEALIPVPLHKKRLKTRGFNQALELAKPIAKQLNLQLEHSACYRQKQTKPQSSLAKNKRKQNVSNAFAMKHPLDYNHVAIIDDVVTTTHTVNAVAKCLRHAGIQTIDVWCAARAQLEL